MKMTRREFLSISAIAAGTLVVSSGLSGCGGGGSAPKNASDGSASSNGSSEQSSSDQSSSVASTPRGFYHGVASGDPQNDKVIIWTRITPADGEDELPVTYEVAEDPAFETLLHNGDVTVTALIDYTVKVDVQNLTPSSTYYYRFISDDIISPVGKMKTLPTGSLAQLKLAVFSCANYPKGYFNAYAEASKHNDLDFALHLGDYIYEYGMLDENGNPAYATENAVSIGRALPSGNDKELLSLEDYRRRYALYRTDKGLQNLHAALPFIAVWDDHEVANDAYKNGAENHDNTSEGSFSYRKQNALRAYFEWMPIRPAAPKPSNSPFPDSTPNVNYDIYRSFEFGDLVALHMLDTRIIGRDKQLSYADYMVPDGNGGVTLDAAAFTAALTNPERTMMGSEQLQWLQQRLTTSTATWQVLGQQVVMGRMNIPAELLSMLAQLEGDLDDAQKQAILQQMQQSFTELAALKTRMLQGDPTLTDEEKARVTSVIPYNLDAWDGYFMERETVLGTALQSDKNLVVLSGDSHNSWANDLKASNPATMKPELQAGVEFAVTSVTSPGLEEYLALSTEEMAQQFEQVLQLLIDDLQYCNLNNRGFMIVTFTPQKAEAEWLYVDNIDSDSYALLATRSKKLAVLTGSENRKLVQVS